MKQKFNYILIFVIATLAFMAAQPSFAAEDLSRQPIFDDTLLLNGYANKFSEESKETLVAMIKDDNLNPLKMAAVVRVFREKYIDEIFSKKKRVMEKTLIRRLNRTVSPFVEVEILHTLCQTDRYRYFKSMVPVLILKLDHYNDTVNELAYAGLSDIIELGSNRTREARIIFTTLRKVLFLSRKRLANVKEPDERLKQKLKILRWSIKVLGTQELKRLPKEVIGLL